MKKISALLKEQFAGEDVISIASPQQPTQSLVLFNGVLSREKIIHLPEIEMLVNHFYGGVALTLAESENAEQLHDWAREEHYKADAQELAMIYHVKTRFEDLTQDTYSDQFSGPLYIQVFYPEETVYDVLTITCHWYDGLFRNDYYLIGVIFNTADLEAIIKSPIS